MNEPRKLVIEESKWYRGKSSRHSRLRRKQDGLMCCLGFDALACGLEKDQITSVNFPSKLRVLPEAMRWLTSHDSDDPDYPLERRIGAINDDAEMTDQTRKEQLTRLFLEGGNIELVFVP